MGRPCFRFAQHLNDSQEPLRGAPDKFRETGRDLGGGAEPLESLRNERDDQAGTLNSLPTLATERKITGWKPAVPARPSA